MASVKLPNHPDNYMLPSAISVHFAPFQDDGSLCDWFDLGNVTNISLTLGDEFLTHESARNGLMGEDKHVVSKVTADLKFTLDEMVGNNLILAFRPNVAADTTAVFTVNDAKRIILSGVLAYDIDTLAIETDATDYLELFWLDSAVDDVLVRSTDGATTYVNGTDYVFTQAAGSGSGRTPATITRVPSGQIADGAEVRVDYQYVRETTEYKLQTGAVLEGALKLQCLNRIGPMFAYYFPFVSISVEGDITIDPSTWFSQAFNAKILTAGDGSRGSFHLFDNFAKSAAIGC